VVPSFLEVTCLTAEQIDFLLGLAAVLAREQATRRDSDAVEPDRVGAIRRDQLVLKPALSKNAIAWSRATCEGL